MRINWAPPWRTWMSEMAVVALVLFGVVAATGGSWVELLGATAVLLTFGHAQVADRLAEKEAERELRDNRVTTGAHGFAVGDRIRLAGTGPMPPGLSEAHTYQVTAVQPLTFKLASTVACHRWAVRYLVGKELLWLAYFVMHRSWAALAGVGVFLAYPLWRRWWRVRGARRAGARMAREFATFRPMPDDVPEQLELNPIGHPVDPGEHTS